MLLSDHHGALMSLGKAVQAAAAANRDQLQAVSASLSGSNRDAVVELVACSAALETLESIHQLSLRDFLAE
jgi:hypothetical protein